METAHFVVVGRVQGVGYRAWTVRTANGLGLTGWVRNRMNGTVEVLAVGETDKISTLRQLCMEGPSWSRVNRLEPVLFPDTILPPIEEGEPFRQIATV